MKLSYTCTHCKQKNILQSNALSRTELHQQHGDTVEARCSNCPKVNQLRLLDIRATSSDFYNHLTSVVMLISLVLGAIFTTIMWKVFVFTPGIVMSFIFTFFALPLSISYQVTSAEQRKVSGFNRSR